MTKDKMKINTQSKEGVDAIAKYCADNFIEPRMFNELNLNKIYQVDAYTGRWSEFPIQPENIVEGMMVGIEADTVEMHSYKGQHFGLENGPTELYVVGIDFDPNTGNLSIMSDGKFVSTLDISEQIRMAEHNEMHLVASDKFQQELHEIMEIMMEEPVNSIEKEYPDKSLEDEFGYPMYEDESLKSPSDDYPVLDER